MSVEQKIRERLDKLALAAAIWGVNTKEPKPSIDEAAQAILQIIEGDVIGGRSWHTCYDSSKCNRDCKGMIENDLRADQRANLREDK